MPKGHSSVYHGMSLWHCPLISVPVKVFHIFLVAHMFMCPLLENKSTTDKDNANTGLAGKLLENDFGPKDLETLMRLDQDSFGWGST